jgi:hypothetical protein
MFVDVPGDEEVEDAFGEEDVVVFLTHALDGPGRGGEGEDEGRGEEGREKGEEGREERSERGEGRGEGRGEDRSVWCTLLRGRQRVTTTVAVVNLT